MCSEATKKQIIENASKENIKRLTDDYHVRTRRISTVGQANQARSYTATFSPAKKYS